MSGHFGLQLFCHLTSQLFYKKGHSYTKTPMCTLLTPATHILGHSHAHSGQTACSKTCNSTKCIPHWFWSQNAHPHCSRSRPPTHAKDPIRNKWHYAVCTAQNLAFIDGAVSYIMLINWDSAWQIVSLKISAFIWMKHSSKILNIKDLTFQMAKKTFS